ncbi:MAG: hypothetical protein ACSHX3_13905 [Litorimonas sp.]
MAAPTILTAAYDPGSLFVQWTLSGTPPTGLTGFRIAVIGSGGFSQNKDVGTSPQYATVAVDLSDESQTYELTVATLINNAPGETSPALTLITKPLTLLSIVYDLSPDKLSVQWTPPSAPADAGLATLAGGGTVKNQTGTTTVAFDGTLTGDGSGYDITVRPIAHGGIVQGPASQAYQPITTPLTLLSIVYDLSPDKLSVQWTPPSAPADAGLATLAGGGTVKNQTGTTTVAFDGTLTGDGSGYDITVRPIAHGGIVQGPASQAYQPITTPLTLLSIVYDLSPDKLSVQWTPPSAPADAGLATLAGGGTVKNQTGTTTVAFDGTLTGDGSGYDITVRPIAHGGIVQGPASQAYQPITTPLTLTVIQYDLDPAASLSVEWNPPAAPADAGLATLSGGGTVKNGTGPVSASFDGQLTGTGSDYNLTARPIAYGGIVQGPASDTYNPITETLSLISLVYDLNPDTLTVQWTPPSAPATGGTATLVGPSELRYGVGETSVAFSITLQTELATGESYQVTFRATGGGGIVYGPPSPAYQPIAAPIALRSLIYDVQPAAVFSVNWDALSEDAEEGMATLSNGATVKTQTGTTGVTFTGVVQDSDAVTSRQIALQGRIQGPSSPVYNPITQSTSMTLVAYDLDPDVATATWEAGSGQNIAYLATLTTEGDTARHVPTADTHVEFNGVLPTDEQTIIAVRVTDATGLAQGPSSDAVTAFTAQVSGARLAYLTSEKFRGIWPPLSGVGGYLYRFNIDGVPGTPTDAPSPSAEIDQAIAAGKIYMLQVRATGTKTLGPWSDPAPGPYLMSATAEHDALGRLTRFDADGYGTFSYSRDAAGNLLTTRFVSSGDGS